MTMVASAAVHCVNQWKHAGDSFVQERVRLANIDSPTLA